MLMAAKFGSGKKVIFDLHFSEKIVNLLVPLKFHKIALAAWSRARIQEKSTATNQQTIISTL